MAASKSSDEDVKLLFAVISLSGFEPAVYSDLGTYMNLNPQAARMRLSRLLKKAQKEFGDLPVPAAAAAAEKPKASGAKRKKSNTSKEETKAKMLEDDDDAANDAPPIDRKEEAPAPKKAKTSDE
ncbi:uncharacterized protein HMPREF1541_04626 [Cyphellophora europaea CBS 101466]|uniref:Uncharacterized protein n=1 Tax=Cyphellophora europaea (strain CBS 101466) TaxID=1220924 RepID=W2RXC2_CYPE1|nr:uncharacterized protein HMPREF1541_04626 [Cyphellophora europaea CBS 101466]ETN40349.1 hypothetical protein HMPREF1541_04626 [Cyphellophora europaea CBS 101466]